MNQNILSLHCLFCKKELNTFVLKNIIINKTSYDLYDCSKCKISMLHPFPSEEELTNLYSCGNYRTNTGKRFGLTIEFLIYLGRLSKRRRISKYVKTGTILDIGCGRGLFLNVMRRGGWHTIGTEFNEETASYAIKTYGLKVLSGDIAQHKLLPESLDAVNISQVLEHLKNPHEVIKESHRLLRSGGIIVISVPDLRSPQFTLGKEKWFLLDLSYHLFHFNE